MIILYNLVLSRVHTNDYLIQWKHELEYRNKKEIYSKNSNILYDNGKIIKIPYIFQGVPIETIGHWNL